MYFKNFILDVLCAPNRIVKKLTDLTDQETADLFNVAKNVQKLIEEFYGVTSSTISIQDGDEAGQTVPVNEIFFYFVLVLLNMQSCNFTY